MSKIKERIYADMEKTKQMDGYSLIDLISATRKFSKNFAKRTTDLEKKTGMEISEASGLIHIRINPMVYQDIKEGYATIISDEIVDIVRYDEYVIEKDGAIRCVRNNVNCSHTPEAKDEDIKRINKYRKEFSEYAKLLEQNVTKTRIDLPDTDLSVLLSGEEVSITHDLNKDAEGTFILNEGADFWLFVQSQFDSIDFPLGAEIIDNMMQFLNDIKVPAESVPDFIKENMGDKISIFTKKHGYYISDYSPVKEKLRDVITKVKGIRNLSKGDLTNEQRQGTSQEER